MRIRIRIRTRALVGAALLVAMNIILTRVTALMILGGTVRLSFGTIPIYLAGLFFGPVVGGLVGGVSDFLGMLINSFGAAFAPQIFLAAIMRGVVPPLAMRVLGDNKKAWQLKIFLAVLVTEIISGALLTTWGIAWLQGTPFIAVLTTRLVPLAVQIPVYTVITTTLMVAMRPLRLLHSERR
ncbi:MAG: folate family ECF transporter S component [Firmicutes bacterium]|nr:folate family ECF transporter S component [Bacillota bacterium]